MTLSRHCGTPYSSALSIFHLTLYSASKICRKSASKKSLRLVDGLKDELLVLFASDKLRNLLDRRNPRSYCRQ